MTKLLVQPQYHPLSNEEITLSLFATKHHFLADVALEDILKYEAQMHKYFKENHSDIIQELGTKYNIDEHLSTIN